MMPIQWITTAQQCDQLAERVKQIYFSNFQQQRYLALLKKYALDSKCIVYSNEIIDAWITYQLQARRYPAIVQCWWLVTFSRLALLAATTNFNPKTLSPPARCWVFSRSRGTKKLFGDACSKFQRNYKVSIKGCSFVAAVAVGGE